MNKANTTQIDGTHYTDMPIQPWDMMETILTHEEFQGFLKGNYIKYAMRAGKKIGANSDIQKAMHYKAKLDETPVFLNYKEKLIEHLQAIFEYQRLYDEQNNELIRLADAVVAVDISQPF